MAPNRQPRMQTRRFRMHVMVRRKPALEETWKCLFHARENRIPSSQRPMAIRRLSAAFACFVFGISACRDPRPSPPPPEPSTTASAPAVSSAPVVASAPSALSSADEPPSSEPIGGIVRSPLVDDPPEACPTGGEYPQVISRKGNLVLCSAPGVEESLTTTGNDYFASFSPKRDMIVFLRAFGQMKVSLGGGDFATIHDNRVWLLSLKDRKEREIGRTTEKDACLSLSSPSWLDDTAILVQANGYEAATIHNLSLCLVDIKSRQIFQLARRTSCAIPITTGRFKGNLFVAPWDFHVGAGLSDWFGVVNRRGQRLRSFEDHPFRRDWNGDGNIMDEEMSPECMDLSAHQAELEKIMKTL